MQTWEKIIQWACILAFIFSLCFALVSASPVDELNLTEGQKVDVCDALNFSVFACVGLWDSLDNYEPEVCNYTGLVNESDYANWTNTVDDQDSSVDIVAQMTLIQGMENVGLAPVFNGLEIVNWTRASGESSSSSSECSSDDYVLFDECEVQKNDIYADCNSAPDNPKEERIDLWWLLLLLVPLYFSSGWIEKKLKQKYSNSAGVPLQNNGNSGTPITPTSYPSGPPTYPVYQPSPQPQQPRSKTENVNPSQGGMSQDNGAAAPESESEVTGDPSAASPVEGQATAGRNDLPTENPAVPGSNKSPMGWP